jgi:hypothetical protein
MYEHSTMPGSPGQEPRRPTRWVPLIPAARAYRLTPFSLSWKARQHEVKAKLVAGHWWFPSSTVPGLR